MEPDPHRLMHQTEATLSRSFFNQLGMLLFNFKKYFKKIFSFLKLDKKNILGLEVEENQLSEAHLKELISKSHEVGNIQKYEKDMIESVFRFNDKSGKDIMTPRKDTLLIDIDDSTEENIDKILLSPYSRIPLYENNIDNIVGVVHVKDLLVEVKKVGFKNIDLKKISKDPCFVPKSKKTNELLDVLKLKKVHMALLVDEYGGFCGVVTMEDLLEEIVGEIEDEHDQHESSIIRLDDKNFIVDCSTSIVNFNSIFKANLQEGEYTTLNGYIISKLGEIPQNTNDLEIESTDLKIKIINISNKKIETVKITFK